MSQDCYYAQGDGYLVRDEGRYPNRFRNFSRYFYHPLVQKAYPLALAEQGLSFFFDEDEMGIQFITLNSAWQIDEWFPQRSSIQQGALERGLERARADANRARNAGQLAEGDSPLRIAVWHHPLTGNEKIHDDAFVGRLMQARVRVCLHGHVHENRAGLAHYLGPRRIHVVGAGSFDAPASHRPESTPRLYNLLEIARDQSTITVHTRHKRRGSGAWQGWAVWPGDDPGQKRTYYTILPGQV